MTRGLVRLSIVMMLVPMAACGGGMKPAEGGAAPPPEKSVKEEPALVPVDVKMKEAQGDFESAESAFTAAGNDCASLCKALSSMTRATDHLCELAKEASEPKRCDDAKARLDAAQSKVKASCGGCG